MSSTLSDDLIKKSSIRGHKDQKNFSKMRISLPIRPKIVHVNLISKMFITMQNIQHQVSTEKKNLRIMICDDDPIIIKSFNNLIKKINNPKIDIVNVSTNNGLECLYKIYHDYLNGELLNILFIDENMPVMNGNTCITNLNTLMSNKELNKFDIISTSSECGEHVSKGCKKIMSKPIRLHELKELFEDY
jgi:CheY-like chemotaxis protein